LKNRMCITTEFPRTSEPAFAIWNTLLQTVFAKLVKDRTLVSWWTSITDDMMRQCTVKKGGCFAETYHPTELHRPQPSHETLIRLLLYCVHSFPDAWKVRKS
jgi:hypothetical protein